MAYPGKKAELFPQLVRLNRNGMTVAAASREVGVSPVTASKWFKDEGVTPVFVRTGRTTVAEAWTSGTCEGPGCTQVIEFLKTRPRRFCSIECANAWQRQQGASEKSCPCGAAIPYEVRHSVKYCSDECRATYGAPKGKPRDPSKWVTFNCQNCDGEVTTRKGQGYHKYCSNECAQRHTKVKQHIVVEDAVVLDSPWEALFWGLCSFYKLPVERYDRERGVEWQEGCWYAPDFWIPHLLLAVEVKGWEDDEDQQRWEAFTRYRRNYDLTILGRGEMETLMKMSDSTTFAGNLLAMARPRGIAQVIKP